MKRDDIPRSALHFDELPDSARVGIATVLAITDKSRVTIFRWVRDGLFPAPRRIGNGHNDWLVGDIRRYQRGRS